MNTHEQQHTHEQEHEQVNKLVLTAHHDCNGITKDTTSCVSDATERTCRPQHSLVVVIVINSSNSRSRRTND